MGSSSGSTGVLELLLHNAAMICFLLLSCCVFCHLGHSDGWLIRPFLQGVLGINTGRQQPSVGFAGPWVDFLGKAFGF